MRRIIWTLWAMYIAVLAVMFAVTDIAWLTPLDHYQQTLVWLTKEATEARVGGLLAANRLQDAIGFVRMNDLSLVLIIVAILAGITQAMSTANPLPLRPRETHYVLGFLAVMTAFSPMTTAWMANLSQNYPQPLYTATPAYWLATMVLSAVLIARYAAFGAHDLVLALRARLNSLQPGITAAE